MNKIVHIVFGDSAKGTLRYFLSHHQNEWQGEIINFGGDYSVGPISEMDTKAGMRKRIEWIRALFKSVVFEECFEDFEGYLLEPVHAIEYIESDTKVVIWHGENTNEQVGLRYVLSLLKNKHLYEVNVSDSYVNNQYGGQYKPRNVAECSPEVVGSLMNTIKKIETDKQKNLLHEWQTLRMTKENLRILKDGKIIGVDETFYDDALLANCTSEFQKAAKIVGMTMGHSEQFVGDTYLDDRVRKLIEAGKLEYQGEFRELRLFDIRLK